MKTKPKEEFKSETDFRFGPESASSWLLRAGSEEFRFAYKNRGFKVIGGNLKVAC